MSDFTWQGVDLRPDHRRWRFWIEQGRDELPTVRRTSDHIPFRRGRVHRPGIANVRQLELRGYVQETTPAEFQATKDMLKGLLDPELEEPGTLVDPQDDGSKRWIHAVPVSVLPKLAGNTKRILSVELEALDPYWYGSYGYATLDSGLILDNGEFLDQGAEIVVVPTSATHNVPLTIPGTAKIERVRVTVKGPSSAAIGVEALSSGVGFGYPRLVPGTTLRVDNRASTVLRDLSNARKDLTLRPANLHGEYIRLSPGAEVVRITGQPAEVRLLFTPTYQ